MSIKIAYVVPVLAPYTRLRCEKLAEDSELEVHVIAENETVSTRTGWKFESIPGCTMHLVKSLKHSFKNYHNDSGYVIDNCHHFSLGIKKLVNKIDPDIVIACNSAQIFMLLGFRKYKIGVVVEDTLRAAEGRKKINKIVKNVILNRADVYFPFSDDAMQFLLKNKIKGPKISSSWSIDTAFFNSVEDRIMKRKELGLEKTTYIIVSSLIPRKGIKQFLNAWKKMPTSFVDNNDLIILGNGPLESELKMITDDNPNIHFMGNKPYNEVSEYLQASDVFVLPTLEDLCSLSVFEAMAAGLPVLTTVYNGARFLIKDGYNGYVFDSESEDSILNILNQIDNSDLKLLSKHALETIRLFDNDVVMQDFGKKIKAYINGINKG